MRRGGGEGNDCKIIDFRKMSAGEGSPAFFVFLGIKVKQLYTCDNNSSADVSVLVVHV